MKEEREAKGDKEEHRGQRGGKVVKWSEGVKGSKEGQRVAKGVKLG